ncbi:MAG: hypothetical protein LBD90_02960 [Bifidobacteriaceae bacterium]|jgi:hypothetical protein|nr:hypothetical protein [Bifidobacteriaceae bacterium]
MFDSLRGVVGRLEEQAQAGEEGAQTALQLGKALKGTLGNLGEAVQQSAVNSVAARQRQAAHLVQAEAVSGVCAALGLSTDRAGNLTYASKYKVFQVLIDAIEFYQEHDFRATKSIHIFTLPPPNGKTKFTLGNIRLGGGGDTSARNAQLFRELLDSLCIRYKERTARNVFELAKGESGSTYVFEVRPERDVPGNWHTLCQIDIKEAVHRLLTMLAELR